MLQDYPWRYGVTLWRHAYRQTWRHSVTSMRHDVNPTVLGVLQLKFHIQKTLKTTPRSLFYHKYFSICHWRQAWRHSMTSKRHWVIIQHWHWFLWIPRFRKPYKLRRDHCSNTNTSWDVIDVKHGICFLKFTSYSIDTCPIHQKQRRGKKTEGAEPVRYRILGNYNTKVPTLKKLLSHTENMLK